MRIQRRSLRLMRQRVPLPIVSLMLIGAGSLFGDAILSGPVTGSTDRKWFGMAIAIAGTLAGIIVLVYYFKTANQRRSHPPGHCLTCGYNLTGNTSGKCPECGEPPPKPV